MFKHITLLILVMIIASQMVFAAEIVVVKPVNNQEFTGQSTVDVEANVIYGLNEKVTQFFSWIQCPGITSTKAFDKKYEPPTESQTLKTSFSALGKQGICEMFSSVMYKKANGEYATSMPGYYTKLLFKDTWPETDDSLTVVRTFPNTKFFPGSNTFLIYLTYQPNKEDITGIILKETLPEGFSIRSDFGKTIAAWGVNDYTYDEDTRLLKLVLMNSNEIKSGAIQYIIVTDKNFQPGEEVTFSGRWEIIGESGDILGQKIVKAEGFLIPGCPITDQQLLQFIEQWSKQELSEDESENDMIIMHILGVWKTC